MKLLLIASEQGVHLKGNFFHETLMFHFVFFFVRGPMGFRDGNRGEMCTKKNSNL